MSLQLATVNVCGQSVEASWKRNEGTPPLQVLKETVEREVGFQQDWVQFYDSNGSKLFTDEEVQTAISMGRSPIYATVSDHSVHNFEQRREEFAHMQWKVMRDQFTVLSLQMAHTQIQLKNLQTEIHVKDDENGRMMTLMKNELADGLQAVADFKNPVVHVEQVVYHLEQNMANMQLQLGEEVMKRDTALQDAQSKMDRQHTAQQHETARLAEAFDSCLNLLQQADSQLGLDMNALEQKMEATRDMANAHHEDALKQVAEARTIAARALSDANSSLLKQAHNDAEQQVNEVQNAICKFETRLIKSESLASDTANRLVTSHDQLKAQYSSLSQTVEQCRLQTRTNVASNQEVRDKLGMQADAFQAQAAALKEEQERERRDRHQQFKNMQQNLEGILKSTLTEFQSKLSNRVDRESDDRTASIRQALDDIGTVLEKEIPSRVRADSARKVSPRTILEQRGFSPTTIDLSPLRAARSVATSATPRTRTPDIVRATFGQPYQYTIPGGVGVTSACPNGIGGQLLGSRRGRSFPGVPLPAFPPTVANWPMNS